MNGLIFLSKPNMVDLVLRIEIDCETERLRERLERKEARIAQLEQLVFEQQIIFPLEWKLTHAQTLILQFLLKRGFASTEQIHTCLYADRIDGGPEIEIVRVYICQLRKKLKPHGLKIIRVVRLGYRLDEETKTKIRWSSSYFPT
ncbi:MAG: winged helix-turn-helix domain-containing protein [Roseibium album]|uniref:winged helix-turn-helix domain-containing protein n=1 Tax=Roseibium album TaxID=311410 RepID=UPI0032EF00F3